MSEDFSIPPQLRDKQKRSAYSPEVQDLLNEGYRDIGVLGKALFPDRFRDIKGKPYTRTHMKLINCINYVHEEQIKRRLQGKSCVMKTVVIGGRGISKSSMIELLLPAWEVTYAQSPFVVSLTHSQTNSQFWTEELRREMVANENVRDLFGSFKPVSDHGIEETFGKLSFVLQNGPHHTLVIPAGRGQAIRGLNYRSHRPQTLIMDDLQVIKLLRNEQIRDEDWDWVLNDVCFSINQLGAESTPATIWLMDTAKHPDTVCERAMKRDDWIHLRIPTANENDESMDEDFITTAELRIEADLARNEGTYGSWASERRACYVSDADSPFKREDFLYYSEKEGSLKFSTNSVTALLVDPARSKNPRSCYTGMTLWTIDFNRPAVYLRAAFGERLDLHEMTDLTATLCGQYNCSALGVELTGLKMFGSPPFEQELMRRGLYSVQFVDLSAQQGQGEFAGEDDSKNGRLLPLSSFYRNHIVWHNSDPVSVRLWSGLSVTSKLSAYESQLCEFDAAQWRDISDSAAYILQLMDKLGLAFKRHSSTVLSEHGMRVRDTSTFSVEEAIREWERDWEAPESDFSLTGAPMYDLN